MLKFRLGPCLGSTPSPRPAQEQAVPDLCSGLDFADALNHANWCSWGDRFFVASQRGRVKEFV
jgi:hypothetical protein